MIVGIESSCDESAVALFDPQQGIVFEEVASQIKLHSQYGGVVPELASREHVKNFIPLLQHLKISITAPVTTVAVTAEPGLPGCVGIGVAVHVNLAKINHLHGHLLSAFIPLHKENPLSFVPTMKKYLPHLGLLVSGGNTAIFYVSENLEITTIGGTVDDAAGEAFDKGGKLLGLPYPSGNIIEKLAETGDKNKFHFPRAFADRDDIRFSFSGLKTSLRYFLEKHSSNVQSDLHDICASYQEAILDALITKFKSAIEKSPEIKSIGISGGVSNNNSLRTKAADLAKQHDKILLLPWRQHTGDNASMIAFAAFIQGVFK